MNNKDLKSLSLFYHGKSRLLQVWYRDIKELHDNGLIKKIYEVYETGFLGAWYMVVDVKNHKYIVKHKINDVNTKFMMMQFAKYYNFEKIDTNLLKVNVKKSA